jgi:hypothetical protein
MKYMMSSKELARLSVIKVALEGSEEDEEGLFTGSNSEGNNSGSDENK